MTYTIHCGDCLDILRTLPAESVDAVITDPPYPMIKRDYGMLTEEDWWALMMGVCTEVRRVLKPRGSAVFILQPNSRKIGSMRGWLWEFMAWVCRDWNMVQDVWWWNPVVAPNGLTVNGGMLRPSIKANVWAGANDCYRSQDSVLWEEAQATKMRNAVGRAGRQYRPSGHSVDYSHAGDAALRRGGVTPFNFLPYANTDSSSKHGASTPVQLADWWTRYIVPAGGTVLDPFNGAGTMGVAALQNGCGYIGIEKMQRYVDVSHERLAKVQPALMEVYA